MLIITMLLKFNSSTSVALWVKSDGSHFCNKTTENFANRNGPYTFVFLLEWKQTGRQNEISESGNRDTSTFFYSLPKKSQPQKG